jgi:hypothetical protein
MISLLIASVKLMLGIYIIIEKREVSTQTLTLINKYLPLELFFAIANSIKYVMVVYMAKWMKKQTLLGMVGIMFTILGLLSWIKYFHLVGYNDIQIK